jgi:hypothetical protein
VIRRPPIATCAGGIPSDAHLCPECKLRRRYSRGVWLVTCDRCAWVNLFYSAPWYTLLRTVRHFRNLGKGG